MTAKQERRRERRGLDVARGYSPTSALGLVIFQALTKIGVKTLYLPTDREAYQTSVVGPSRFEIVLNPQPQEGGFKITVERMPT